MIVCLGGVHRSPLGAVFMVCGAGPPPQSLRRPPPAKFFSAAAPPPKMEKRGKPWKPVGKPWENVENVETRGENVGMYHLFQLSPNDPRTSAGCRQRLWSGRLARLLLLLLTRSFFCRFASGEPLFGGWRLPICDIAAMDVDRYARTLPMWLKDTL